VCQTVSDLPDPEIALQNSDLSLGEAHDYYELAIYTITNDRCFHFIWRIFPKTDSLVEIDYALHEATISWETFDAVISTVTRAVEAEILDKSGSKLSFG